MKRFHRFIFQAFLWLIIWSSLYILADTDARFIAVNAPTYILQVFILAGLIYYAIPKLLLQKRHTYFLLLTIPILLVSAFFATQVGPVPPPIEHFARNPQMGPPRGLLTRYAIHLLILSISSMIGVVLEIFIDAQHKEKRIAFAKAELMESELKFLKMQINPHFLFNALNNIYALSVINSNKTQESIGTLSEMLRYVIYDCEQAKVPLRKELEYIENYIALFELKSSKTFDILFHKQVTDETTLVAPMLFVPYIENAFKHSGIEKGNENFVHISLIQGKNTIEFSVENSVLSSPDITDSQGGIGLPNVQKRLEILYPHKHELKIVKSTTFKVGLKLETE